VFKVLKLSMGVTGRAVQLLYAISSPSAAVLILIYMVAVLAALARLLLGGVHIGLINYDYASMQALTAPGPAALLALV
jgi:hypothetical protein